MAKPRKKRAPKAVKPAAGAVAGGGVFLAVVACVGAAAFPVAMTRLSSDALTPGAFFAPLLLWLGALLASWWVTRPSRFGGDRLVVALTLLLLGLGIVEQWRLGTWAEAWHAWRAYLPLLGGVVGWLFCLRCLRAETVAAALPRVQWLCWLGALGVLAALRLFGRSYRGGMFLPGQINPTELVKVLLVAFTAAWLPARTEALARTVVGVPVPPLREALALAVLWGVPLVGAVAVRDLGLVLILCLTLMLMLCAATRKVGWLAVGLSAAAAAGWGIRFLSAHSAARFAVWLDPFQDPTGKGWQIGQSLCAQFAGGLWGTGLGEGMPGTVPIVTSDFVYAALAEEWGLVGCALVLGGFWLWIWRSSRAMDEALP
ncbi:MAG: FtsW/RodA/SpoVE family cell cycle protein, partial [Candidatus Spyradenecus sp.]